HNKKIESHNPNKNTLSHTPIHHLILSYENIPAELAWEMNVPLVWGYNGIWLYNSCAGGEATETFFHHCEGIEFYTVCWKFGDYKSAYIDLYQHYLQGKNILFSFNAWQKGAEKFAHLLDKKVPIFSVTRDYISRLKTGVNHISGTEPITDKFKNLSLNSEIIFPQIHYRGAYKMKPDIDILQTLDNFSLQWGDFGGLRLRLDWLKNATSDIHFIPIDEISGDKAFHTFVNLSKKLHFNVPNNPKAFSGKVNRYEGLLMLPCTLRANTKDIDKNAQEAQIEILITTHQLTPNNDHKLTDMTNFIGIDTPQKNLVLYIKQEEFRILTENKLLFDAVQSYFQRYFHALQSYIENLKNNLFSEQDILNYLKNNPQLALAFKKQIQEDITLIKSHRSDIIESWKYYQEFERICKELEENDNH
ncbi:DUF2972 domain-containing protein, partial [Helicobacter sp. MIT 05-5293]|uniref:DUF2972 domain-containing protein n=1 Tax=Helicobacter sp. MIT 05-5293 TaxID=1548149 RepID=UPI0010FE5DFF